MIDESIALNRLAREKMKLRLYNDILIDLTICEIEGWDKREYINELKDIINGLGGKIVNSKQTI